MNIIAMNLKNLRLKKNITLEQLAVEINEMFNIHITGSMLSKWETGKAAPIYDHLKRLASYYDVTTDFLIGFNKYNDLIMVKPNNNLDTNKKIRNSKKFSNIRAIVKLLEDDRITNKDVSFIKDFITIYISNKYKNYDS
jgi:transcriptional regulator with XRE-family HTH domain